MLFIDVAKAFDRVSHKAITQAALDAGVDPKLVRYIAEGYRRQDTTLEMQGSTRRVKTG